MLLSPPKKWRGFLEDAGRFCAGAGLRCWAVGGCARDWLLGRDTKDIDIVCEGGAEPLSRHLRGQGASVKSYGAFGTFCAELPGGLRVDLAGARSETYARPAALPRVRPASIAEDLLRRDFAANAAALNLLPENFGELLDPLGAAADSKAGLLRVLHGRSFYDDPTRLYRACRFAGRFGWRLESGTEKLFYQAIKEELPARLSRERLARELMIILDESDPRPAFGMMEKSGLGAFLHPKLRWHEAAAKVSGAGRRLGVLACAMGRDGPEFIASLRLERAISAPAKNAAAVLLAQSSPRRPLGGAELEIIRALYPQLPPAAPERLLLPADAAKSGVKGPALSAIMDRAAAAQWRGEFSDRKTALEWLERILK
ncbi:MAG: hypothetical protein WC421_11245 [Elusimicrobiales bacterium]